MNKKEKKTSSSMNPFVPLLLMVLACAIVSYFVSPGAYDRETIDGVTRVLPESYHAVERTPISFFNLFRSIPEGLTATANMMFCVMIIGGIVEIYKRTDTVGAAINSVLKASEKMSSQVIIAVVMIVFFIFGGILGWSEHIIPFVPIIISLAISLGYDSLVGMAISGFACLISFAVAPFNVYTVGISHTIAELPMFSGWQLRMVALVTIWVLSLAWVMRYAKIIKADPTKSLVKDVDVSSLRIPVDNNLKFDMPKKLSFVVLGISILCTIYGILKLSWSYTEMATTFMIGGVIVAVINKVNFESAINMVLDGAKGAFNGALIIGVARAVQWTMTNGGLIDPLVHGLSKLMGSASAYMSTIGMFIVNFFINALIPSGSGQATAVMPIMVPLADMLHITRQTAVLAFQFGDGISNTFWFTNGTLLIYLSLGKIPLKSWYKFILPLQGIFFLVEFIFLFIAVQSGYGPF
ncbi:MAG: YfcC family protein [Hungatella sp.]|nr:YfcC family protein [Hungatella sp.]